MQKYMPLVKQNVMKFEVFILGSQRIDQKEIRDGAGEDPGGLHWLHLQPPLSNFFFVFLLELHAHATKTHHPL